MGYIDFISIKDNSQSIGFESLSAGRYDELALINSGDLLTLYYKVDPAIGETLLGKEIPGVRVARGEEYSGGPKNPHVDVILNFHVLNKRHTVSQDWMCKEDPNNLRVQIEMETVRAQAESLEAEDVLLWIREGTVPAWVN